MKFSKPRAQNGDVNRSVNIMSDSRVVRRSTFSLNASFGKANNYRDLNADYAMRNENDQYIMIDRRLIHRSVFTPPIGIVIDVKESRDANVKHSKCPVSTLPNNNDVKCTSDSSILNTVCHC